MPPIPLRCSQILSGWPQIDKRLDGENIYHDANIMEVFSIRQDGENFDGSLFYLAQGKAMKNIAEKLIERESRPDKVGNRVTAIRETLALSKAQFADNIGLDRSSLTNHMQSAPTPFHALQVTVHNRHSMGNPASDAAH